MECDKRCNANAFSGSNTITVLLLVSVFAAGAANIALAIFAADRLMSKSGASIVASDKLSLMNDNVPASASVKLAA